MKELVLNQEITFIINNESIRYNVRSGHLSASSYTNNDIIFNLLGLSSEEKYKLASECYGYNTYYGDWLTYSDHDFAAADRADE